MRTGSPPTARRLRDVRTRASKRLLTKHGNHQEVHRVAPSLDRGAACRGTPRPYPRRPRPSSSTRARSASAGRTLHLPAPPVITAASSALPLRPPERGARRPALRRPRAHDVVRSCRPLHPPPPPQRRRARQEISPRPAIVLLPQPTALASRRAALPDLCCTSAPVRHGNTAGAAPAAATAGARGGAETPLPLHLATLVAQRRQALSSGLLNPQCSSCANSAQRAAPCASPVLGPGEWQAPTRRPLAVRAYLPAPRSVRAHSTESRTRPGRSRSHADV